MGNNLKKLREAHGLTQDQVAAALGTTRNYYVKLEGRKRPLGQRWVDGLAKLYQVDPGDVVTEGVETVPVVGYVAAGSEMLLYSEGQGAGEYDYVDAPDGSTESTVAVEIKGHSLGEAFDGWLVFYDNIHNPPTTSQIGHLCVVELSDGRVVVKKLRQGQLPGSYTLLSNTEPPMYDKEVKWAAKVILIRPR